MPSLSQVFVRAVLVARSKIAAQLLPLTQPNHLPCREKKGELKLRFAASSTRMFLRWWAAHRPDPDSSCTAQCRHTAYPAAVGKKEGSVQASVIYSRPWSQTWSSKQERTVRLFSTPQIERAFSRWNVCPSLGPLSPRACSYDSRVSETKPTEEVFLAELPGSK